jgi:hypothetical protein
MDSTASFSSRALGRPCFLAEPDGTELASGTLYDWCCASGEQWLSVRLDRPGRVIKRCLTERYRIAFVPRLGQVCVLRLADELPEHDRFPRASNQATPVALTWVIPAQGDVGSPASR